MGAQKEIIVYLDIWHLLGCLWVLYTMLRPEDIICLDQQVISVCHQGFCSQKEQMASSKYLRTAYEELCVER